MATNTSTTTANYGLSQYGANDPVKVLTNYNSDMTVIDAAIKAAKDQSNDSVKLGGKAASAFSTLTERTNVPAHSDLHSYTVTGTYACSSNADVSTLLNCPAKSAFIMDVNFPTGNEWYRGLTITEFDTGIRWYSEYDTRSAQWGSWIMCPTETSGTWTPTLFGVSAAGAPTYTVQAGSWRKVGKMCFVNFSIGISAKGGVSGNLLIGGLPFVPSENSAVIIGFPLNTSLPDPFNTFGGYVMALTTSIQLVTYSRTGTGNADDTNITDTFSLNSCSCLYEIQ